jgi:hypothetical protein
MKLKEVGINLGRYLDSRRLINGPVSVKELLKMVWK